jgi:hypothetical protein
LLLQVQLKYAMFLEDEGRFRDAEEAFIKVSKPREAIDMYVHQQDWAAALRVADLCDPAAMPEILVRSMNVHYCPPHTCWCWPLVNDSYQQGALLELF